MLLSRMLRKPLSWVSSCGVTEGGPMETAGVGVSTATAFTCAGCLSRLSPHCSFQTMPRWPANEFLLVLLRGLLQVCWSFSLGP